MVDKVNFISDPFCVTCELELRGALICFNNTRCEKHEAEFDAFRQSEFMQEIRKLFEEENDFNK